MQGNESYRQYLQYHANNHPSATKRAEAQALLNVTGDTAWIDAQKYTGRAELYKGELGRLHKVRFIEASSNQKEEASTTTVYSNFIHGQEAFGVVDLAGSGLKKIIIKQSDKGDTSNPLNQFMTIGWKAEAFASAILDPKWIINVKTGAKD